MTVEFLNEDRSRVLRRARHLGNSSLLQQNYDAQIVAFCADIGQEEELEGLEEKARHTGATKCIIEDLREEFARDFVFPMFQARAIYEGQYFLGTSIARPLIAKRMIEIARAEGADTIAHGATGKGNDQVRFGAAKYDQTDATGFIPLNALRLKTRGQRRAE